MGDAGQQGDGAESRTEPVAEGGPVRRPQGGCPQPTPLAALHTRLRHSPCLGAAASAFPAPGWMPTQMGCLPLRRVHFWSLNAQDTPVPRPASGGTLIPRGSVRSKGKTARDLSQPGPGDLSPLTQVGFGHRIPPVSSKGLRVKETPTPGRKCVCPGPTAAHLSPPPPPHETMPLQGFCLLFQLSPSTWHTAGLQQRKTNSH